MPIVDEGRIQSLLADGRITSLTVDTNIFDEKRLHLNSKTLQVLASLKDEPISFVLSATVVKEVSAHIEKAVEDALRTAKKGIGQALFAFETKEPTRDELITRISGGRSAPQAAQERIDKYISKTLDAKYWRTPHWSTSRPFSRGISRAMLHSDQAERKPNFQTRSPCMHWNVPQLTAILEC